MNRLDRLVREGFSCWETFARMLGWMRAFEGSRSGSGRAVPASTFVLASIALGLASGFVAGPALGRSTHQHHHSQVPTEEAGTLSGDLGDLSHSMRDNIQKRISEASRRIGGPLSFVIVKELHHDSVVQVAESHFDDWGLDRIEGNPIVVAVAVKDGQAAIETGKGPAGIVPEIDAQDIVTRLTHHLSHKNLGDRLDAAIRAIVDSAEATRLRRQPLPPDAEEVAAKAIEAQEKANAMLAATVDAGSPPTSAAETDAVPDGAIADAEDAGADAGSTATPASRSPDQQKRLPIAVAVAVVILLGIALRKRRQFTAERSDTKGSDKKPGDKKPQSSKNTPPTKR